MLAWYENNLLKELDCTKENDRTRAADQATSLNNLRQTPRCNSWGIQNNERIEKVKKKLEQCASQKDQ